MKRLHRTNSTVQNVTESAQDSEASGEDKDQKIMDCFYGWLVTRNFTGKINGENHCVCEVLLPDSSFPAKRVGALEDETLRLTNRVEDEMQKIGEQDIRLDSFMEKVINLTKRIEKLEKLRPEGLIEINFDVLKKEIKEMELVILELRGKVNGSNAHVESLYKEVKTISKTVGQLETLDKNNVLKAQREMENLKKRLADCEKNIKMKGPPMVPLGSCQHQGLSSISKPNLLQLNWKGVMFKSGAWGKDAAWNTTKKSLYWVAPLNPDGRIMESIRVYPSLNDLLLYKNSMDLPLSVLIKNKWNHTFAGQGAGAIVYNNNLYYNCYNSRDMCRVSLSNGVYQRKPLPNAVFNNRYPYSGVAFQDMDFASDEKGLWVVYSTEESDGRLILGKINVATLTVDKAWSTTQMKVEATNAFMMCGVLYVTRSVSKKTEEIFYMFDTKTGKGGPISFMIEKINEKVQSLSYNANERKLYMYNDGYLVHYDVAFKP
ncbi:olfactomedin-like [Hyla sarda]|uniref:olfactomedin-like n=1 Tax=Hyla sarda TaxID=327740 RepID=UPI0024C2C364|nr:olfactomedin-like [Hyla sarda]XP_056394313.1 olfactomedin-like [Hyla sarda]XP_056394314.1 olfactomedin-like [Hyla sarda]